MLSTGSIIKLLREKHGYNQDVLADYLSVKRELVSYYETGAREAPLEVLEKLALLFGVDLEVFFAERIEDIDANMAFAFRAENHSQKELSAFAEFKKIIFNYQRIARLEEKNAER